MNAKTAGGVWRAGKTYVLAHKVISGIAIVIILVAVWWIWGKATSASAETRYILGTVSSSTIVSTVSGSGQISSSDSVDIKPKVSGEITWVGVTAGQKVRAGQAIASIDNTDAKQSVLDAKQSLQAAQLQLQKDTAQAPADYQNDQNALATAKENLVDDYNDTFNDLSNTYLDLPNIMTVSLNTLYGYDLDTKKNQWNMDVLTNLFTSSSEDTTSALAFKASAKSDYASAKSAYDAAVAVYQQTTRTSSNDTVDALLKQSIALTTAVAQALQSELNFLGSISDLAQAYNVTLPSAFATIQSNARTNLSSTNSDLSMLLADKKTLDTTKQNIINAQQTVTLDQVGNSDGSNPISLQISKNSIQKQETDLAQLEADLADYTIVAPFDGTISAVDVKVGDTASGAVATVITNQNVAQLSLNEIDAAKVAVGQKATLTFDAIDGLTLTGTVAEVDTVGTVSQGVVSYTVKISLDTQDSRIKSGMTVNAEIQTAAHQDVLVVPSSAVKTVGGVTYVQVFTPAIADTGGATGVVSATPPQQVEVTTGISDDTNIEILSGLSPGEQIVTRTSTGATSAARPTTTTGAAGARGGFGGGGATLRAL